MEKRANRREFDLCFLVLPLFTDTAGDSTVGSECAATVAGADSDEGMQETNRRCYSLIHSVRGTLSLDFFSLSWRRLKVRFSHANK